MVAVVAAAGAARPRRSWQAWAALPLEEAVVAVAEVAEACCLLVQPARPVAEWRRRRRVQTAEGRVIPVQSVYTVIRNTVLVFEVMAVRVRKRKVGGR